LNRVTDILQNVQDSTEQQKVEIDRYKSEIDAYNAETKRIGVVSGGMTPEQIQEIVMNTIAAAMDTGDLIDGAPEMREMPDMADVVGMQGGGMAPEMPPQMPMGGEMPMEGEMPPEGLM
jgi:hypothetical protein